MTGSYTHEISTICLPKCDVNQSKAVNVPVCIEEISWGSYEEQLTATKRIKLLFSDDKPPNSLSNAK